jgi:hypothetical protein
LKERGGGRNARATSRVSAFLEIPRRFTLANHRLPLALPQSSGKLGTLTFFAEPTVGQIVASRNIKDFDGCAEPVDDRPSLWKNEEN